MAWAFVPFLAALAVVGAAAGPRLLTAVSATIVSLVAPPLVVVAGAGPLDRAWGATVGLVAALATLAVLVGWAVATVRSRGAPVGSTAAP